MALQEAFEHLFSATEIERLKTLSSLTTQTCVLTYARYAYQCNSFRELIFSQLLHFKEGITDIKIERCKKQNLVDILMIVFLEILCGYKSEGKSD